MVFTLPPKLQLLDIPDVGYNESPTDAALHLVSHKLAPLISNAARSVRLRHHFGHPPPRQFHRVPADTETMAGGSTGATRIVGRGHTTLDQLFGYRLLPGATERGVVSYQFEELRIL